MTADLAQLERSGLYGRNFEGGFSFVVYLWGFLAERCICESRLSLEHEPSLEHESSLEWTQSWEQTLLERLFGETFCRDFLERLFGETLLRHYGETLWSDSLERLFHGGLF